MRQRREAEGERERGREVVYSSGLPLAADAAIGAHCQ